MLNQMAQSEGTKAMVVTLETSMGHVHVVGERIINQKTIASKMQDFTSVTSKGTWQKCAGQSNQAPQHPYTNVHNKLIILRRLQLVTLTFLFSNFMISRRNRSLRICVFKVPTLLLKSIQEQLSPYFLKKLTENIFQICPCKRPPYN